MKEGEKGFVYLFGSKIKLDDKIFGIWCMPCRDEPDPDEKESSVHANISLCLYEDSQNERFTLGWRIRLYMDRKVENSKDQNIPIVCHMGFKDHDRESAVKKCAATIAMFEEMWHAKAEGIQGEWITAEEFMKRAKENPPSWLHAREASPDNPEDMKKIAALDPSAAENLKKIKEKEDKQAQDKAREKYRL